MPMMNAANSSHQTRWVGAGAYRANALGPISPRACPPVGAALETTGVMPLGPQVEQCRTGGSGDQANGDAVQRATHA